MKFLLILVFCIAGAMAVPLTPEQQTLWSNHNNYNQNAEFQMFIILRNNFQIFPQIASNDYVGFSKKAKDVINFLTEASNVLGQDSLDADIRINLINMVLDLGINKGAFFEFRIAMTSFLNEQYKLEPRVQDDWINAFDLIYYATFKQLNFECYFLKNN
ncbi:hypothetical protein ACKWTF_004667 [Chironomus riparius]